MLALRIALHWGREPNWYYGLDKPTKLKVLTEYRISMMSQEDIQNRRKEIKKQAMIKVMGV